LLECPPILSRPRTQVKYVLEILYDKRLSEEIQRTEPNRFDCGFDIPVLRQDKYFHRWKRASNLSDKPKASTRDANIGNQTIDVNAS
jgi:hypothetical protein